MSPRWNGAWRASQRTVLTHGPAIRWRGGALAGNMEPKAERQTPHDTHTTAAPAYSGPGGVQPAISADPAHAPQPAEPAAAPAVLPPLVSRALAAKAKAAKARQAALPWAGLPLHVRHLRECGDDSLCGLLRVGQGQRRGRVGRREGRGRRPGRLTGQCAAARGAAAAGGPHGAYALCTAARSTGALAARDTAAERLRQSPLAVHVRCRFRQCCTAALRHLDASLRERGNGQALQPAAESDERPLVSGAHPVAVVFRCGRALLPPVSCAVLVRRGAVSSM